MTFHLYYDDRSHCVYIDEQTKQTKVDLPPDVAALDARYLIGSEAVHYVIKQLIEQGGNE